MKRPSLLLLFCLLPLGAFAQDPWEARIARAAAPYDHQVSWPTRVCYDYQVEVSPDLAQWVEFDTVEAGTGSTITYKLLSDADRLFYRVRETPDLPAYLVYVKVGGTGAGTSWADPRGSIQVAVTLAAAHPGAEVWVAEGVYIENVTLAPAVGVYGGFAGDETVRCERDPDSHETVIDGDGNTVVTAPADVDGSGVLDGFTIRNGSYGVDCAPGASPVIANNVIVGNADSGIYCDSGSAPTIRRNVIESNSGGIECFGSSAWIIGNVITRNSHQSAGGVRCWGFGDHRAGPTISRNQITANWSSGTSGWYGRGAGIFAQDLESVVIIGNLIQGNTSAVEAGGIFCDAVDDVLIRSNYLGGNVTGTGVSSIYCLNTKASILNNTVRGTNATQPAWEQGAITFEGAGSEAWIFNNIIADNHDYGLKWFSDCSVSSDYNCLFENASGNYGGAAIPGPNDFGDFGEEPIAAVGFAPDGYHIQPNSPCVDVGDNSQVGVCDEDIDGQPRIDDEEPEIVDVGCDESFGTTWYSLTLSAGTLMPPVGQHVEVVATVFDPSTDTCVPNWPVYFDVARCELIDPVDPAMRETGGSGEELGKAPATVTKSSPGSGRVTATIYLTNGQPVSASLTLLFRPEEAAGMGDWPMFMGNPQHTGLLAMGNPPDPDEGAIVLELVWTAEAPTAPTSRDYGGWLADHPHADEVIFEHPYMDSSPVVSGGAVVVGTWHGPEIEWDDSWKYENSPRGDIRCFAADSGELIWAYPPLEGGETIGGVASTPCIFDDKVLVGSADGNFYCMDLVTGEEIWSAGTTDRSDPQGPSKIIGSPVVYEDAVREKAIAFVGNEAGKLYAWDVGNGDVLQDFPVELDLTGYSTARQNLTGISSPAVAPTGADDYLVFGCDNGRLYRLNLRTHQLEEGYVQLGSCIESSPAIHAEYAYVGITAYLENCFFKIDVNTFAPPLGTELPNECRATPALRPGTGDPPTPDAAFVGVDTGDTFHKLRLSDLGAAYEPAFDVNVGAPQHFVGSAAIVGGVVLVGNDNGYLYVLRAEPLPAGDPPLPPDQRWRGGEPAFLDADDDQSGGYVCSSPALSTNIDSEDDLWVFVTTRDAGGALFAFRVVQE